MVLFIPKMCPDPTSRVRDFIKIESTLGDILPHKFQCFWPNGFGEKDC